MKNLLFATLTFCLFILNGCSKKETTPDVVYSKVSVTKMTIINYPIGDANGLSWDAAINGTYPDVYFKITNSGTTTALFSLSTSNRAENLKISDLPYGWVGTSGAPFFVLSDLTQAVDVDLYDYDSVGSDQYMGSSTFNFNNYTTGSNKYPTSITVTNGSVSIKLDLIWLQ